MLGQIFAAHFYLGRYLVMLGLSIISFLSSPVQAGPIQLTGAEPATGRFQISPDSQYVVYAAYQAIGDSFWQLYSTPLRGSAPVQLNLPTPGERIFDYAISADGSRVVYQSDADLYSVPIAGPASVGVKLNDVTLVGSVQRKFLISPDGSRVVYRTSDDLYSIPIDGPAGASIKLNIAAPLPADPGLPGAIAPDFIFSPDSRRVLYVAHTDVSALSLFSAPVDGPAGASVLIRSLPAGAGIEGLTASSDSQRVLYLSDENVDAIFELYSAPVAGPADASVKLNLPLENGESVYGFTVTADATRVVYVKGYELYSVPIAGPADASVRLNDPQTTARIDSFEISMDGQWVVFQVGDLYRAPINGPASAIIKLTDVAAVGREVDAFHISPDSRRVVYSGYEALTSPVGLYLVPIDGPINASVKLNRPLATAEQPLFFQISPDGQSVVYEAHQDSASKNELYGAPIGGPASDGVKLNSEMPSPGIRPLHWQISTDSSRVVYVVGVALYAAELDNLSWITAGNGEQPTESTHTYLPFMQR